MRATLLTCLASSIALAGDPCAKVTQKQVGDGLELWAELSTCSEATFSVTAEETNVVNQLPSVVDAGGRKRFLLAKWRRADGDAPWTVRDWKYKFKVGRRHPSPPSQTTGWRYPFEGKRAPLQKPHGTFSHFAGSQDEEAYDWAMDEGTEVLAAKDGVVIGVRSDRSEGGVDDSLKNESNYVMLRHADGLFSEYNHLQLDGVKVKLGDRVKAGQLLGLSGNTGYTSRPHLHFSVFYNVDGTFRVTVPIVFDATGSSEAGSQKDEELRKATQDAVDAFDAIVPR